MENASLRNNSILKIAAFIKTLISVSYLKTSFSQKNFIYTNDYLNLKKYFHFWCFYKCRSPFELERKEIKFFFAVILISSYYFLQCRILCTKLNKGNSKFMLKTLNVGTRHCNKHLSYRNIWTQLTLWDSKHRKDKKYQGWNFPFIPNFLILIRNI